MPRAGGRQATKEVPWVDELQQELTRIQDEEVAAAHAAVESLRADVDPAVIDTIARAVVASVERMLPAMIDDSLRRAIPATVELMVPSFFNALEAREIANGERAATESVPEVRRGLGRTQQWAE